MPFDSQQRPSTTAAPFTPSTGPEDPANSTSQLGPLFQGPVNWWYTSPQHHLPVLEGSEMTMTHIQQELIQAYYQLLDDLAWVANEIEKERENGEQS